MRNDPFSDPDPLGIISITSSSRGIGIIEADHRYAVAARRMLVLPGHRMDDRRAERIFTGRPGAATSDGLLEVDAFDLDAAADGDIVNGNAGVLAEQVIGLLGDSNVLDHGRQNGLAGTIRLGGVQALEPLLDVVREHLQRPDIKEFCGFLDGVQINLHGSFLLSTKTTQMAIKPHRRSSSRPAECG